MQKVASFIAAEPCQGSQRTTLPPLSVIPSLLAPPHFPGESARPLLSQPFLNAWPHLPSRPAFTPGCVSLSPEKITTG